MEVKIGVQYAARELVLESGQTPDEVQSAVEAALQAGGVLMLADERGRRIIIPVDKIGYVEIGESLERRVGFGGM